jgi:hypothetical protein
MSDVASTRFRNTQRLLDEFISSRSGVEEVRGIETQFALHLGISKNYWSALKTGKRQIGAILARQFEARAEKPVGWLDQAKPSVARITPQNDEEWFAVGLLLSAYRAAPETTKATLVELVEHALQSSSATSAKPRKK